MSVNWAIIGSGNDLSPVRRQAIPWSNAGLLSTGFLGTICSEIRIGILSFSFNKMHWICRLPTHGPSKLTANRWDRLHAIIFSWDKGNCHDSWVFSCLNCGQVGLVNVKHRARGEIKCAHYSINVGANILKPYFNALAPGRCGCNPELVIFKAKRISPEILPRWILTHYVIYD